MIIGKKYNLKTLFTAFITGIICLFLCILILTKYNSITQSNNLVILTFFVSMAISLIGLFQDKSPFSLNKTFWIFNFIFFGVTPLIQYLNNASLWDYKLTNIDYLNTNYLIIFSQIIYLIFRYLSVRVCNNKYKNKCINKTNIQSNLRNDKNTQYCLISLLISFISFILLGLFVGFSNLLVRSGNSLSSFDDQFMNTIVSIILRVTPVYCCVFTFNKVKKINLYIIAEFILVLLCNWPTSSTRYLIGAIYMGFILLLFKKFNNKRLYDVFLIGLLCVLFPLFQTYKGDGNSIFNVSYDLENAFNNVDFDAYSILARANIYVQSEGSVMGGQVIGTILFFIPRKIWPSKPNPSGEFLADYAGQWFKNISCPFVAEGLLNFGIIGIVLFVGLLSYFTNKIDYKFWYGIYEKKNNRFRLIYPFVMGLYIYVLRGALHVTAIYTFIFLSPLIFIKIFNRIRRNRVLD